MSKTSKDPNHVPSSLKEFQLMTMFQKQRLYKNNPAVYKKFSSLANKVFNPETDYEAAAILRGDDSKSDVQSIDDEE